MSHPTSSQIIFDHIWPPLVHVPDSQLAYLVHPGTTIQAQALSTGWHWHWPLLTSIRQISLEKVELHFSQNAKTIAIYYDEPITAVSHDHQLFTSQGIATISINPEASIEVLSRLNRHSIKRIIRPLVRQSVRQTIAQFESGDVSSTAVEEALMRLAEPLFDQHGLIIHAIKLSSLDSYQPQVTQ